MNEDKLSRFRILLQEMLNGLRRQRHLVVHQRIDESYYMEKDAEFTMLAAQWKEAKERLADVELRVERHYLKAYCQWSRDVRWLSRYRSMTVEKVN